MSRVWVAIKRFGRVIKFLFVCLVVAVCVFMVWRIFAGGTPKEIKTLLPTDDLKLAYSQKGDELYIFEQKYDDITRAEYNEGYFAVPEAVFIPEINEAQIVFRYNNSTVRSIAEDKGLEEIPSLDAYLFDLTLSVQLDLTPENDTDNGGDIKEAVEYRRIKPSQTLHGRKALYNYYRYVFDFDDIGVSLTEAIESGELLAVYTDIYFCYETEVDYEETADGVLCIYDYKTDIVEQRLKGRDRRAIKNFIKG